jgi:hypothetical protein
MTTDLKSTNSPVAAVEAPVSEVQRTETLDSLARSRPGGTQTLGELAEASGHGQGPTELGSDLREAGAHAAAPRSRRWLVTFLGGYHQRGRWRLGKTLRLISVLGAAELDLHQAIVDADEVSLVCLCVLGGATLISPEGVPVTFSGLSILGGRRDEREPAPPLPAAPTIHVRLFSLLGGVRITSGIERGRRSIELGDDALTVRLSGLLGLAAVRRELRIPYKCDPRGERRAPELPPARAIRVRTALPFSDIRHGLIRWHGRSGFYSLNDRHRTITLRLDGFTIGARPVGGRRCFARRVPRQTRLWAKPALARRGHSTAS